MNKQSMKELCEMNDRAWNDGVLSAGGYCRKTIQLKCNKFIELFGCHSLEPFDRVHNKMVVEEDGFEFFTLIPKGGEQ